MLLGEIFERFVEQSPTTVMVRGVLEKVLAPEKLDELFERTAKVQYTRELLFSAVVNLMSLVVCGIRPSVNAAYKAQAQEIGVSRTALYSNRHISKDVTIRKPSTADLAQCPRLTIMTCAAK